MWLPSREKRDVSLGGGPIQTQDITSVPYYWEAEKAKLAESTSVDKLAETEETAKSRSQPILLDDPNPNSESSYEKDKYDNIKRAETAPIDLDEEDEELGEEVKINRQKENKVDRHPITPVQESITPAEPEI